MDVDEHPFMLAVRAGLHEIRHAALLLCMVEEPGLSVRDYAERLGVTKPVISRGLRALEDFGFATRRGTKEDRRLCLMFPTDRGRRVLTQIAGGEVNAGQRAKGRGRTGQNGRGSAGRV
jgi:DNA-binding MarR family transcriptional regulator